MISLSRQPFLFNLTKPMVGLAPIDGVTDTAYRQIVDKYSKPSIMFTEFIPVEGIFRGAVKLLHAFHSHKTNVPVIGQVFGVELNSFYNAFFVVAEMGLQGIDINMGCPDRSIIKRGGGAALIQNSIHAQNIIKVIKNAKKDWIEGKTIKETQLTSDIKQYVSDYQKNHKINIQKKSFTISVKTRLGYLVPETNNWISQLLEEEPDLITLHGRTLKQMYTGKADWEEIEQAAHLCKKTNTLIFGNGDIDSMQQAKEHIDTYKVDGVLVGRAVFGNPWFFSDHNPTLKEKFTVMLEHAQLFVKYRQNLGIAPLRKHFCWYCNGFPEYRKVREKLMKANTIHEVKNIVEAI